ncbi:MAG: hypothetical protein DLM73_13485 [Chthoniobacterales bacterium]|nr:MAG: hypothetical protein DLM73_13485 [Chthoniobacterales bacterium]
MWRFPSIALAAGLLLAAATIQADPATAPEPVSVISHIKRVPVESTALASVGYSKHLHALEIEFRNGAIYRYLEVDPSAHRELMNAKSKARYYDENIRKKYRSVHVRRQSE